MKILFDLTEVYIAICRYIEEFNNECERNNNFEQFFPSVNDLQIIY